MISFRHHVVSLVAVLLALAAGVALGGGPLTELGRGADADLETENATLRADLDSARSTNGLADQLAGKYDEVLVKGSLADRAVALVTLPGADPEVVDALAALVTSAGGTVSGRYAVGPDAYRSSGKSLVDTLGAELADGHEEIPAAATTYVRLGHLVGLRMAGSDEALASSLTAADLVVADDDAASGTLALVVAGDDKDADLPALAALLSGLSAELEGTLVVASSGSATDGPLAALRADTTFAAAVSTADGAESAAGRLVAVVGLAADAAGTTGHWGARGESGVAP